MAPRHSSSSKSSRHRRRREAHSQKTTYRGLGSDHDMANFINGLQCLNFTVGNAPCVSGKSTVMRRNVQGLKHTKDNPFAVLDPDYSVIKTLIDLNSFDFTFRAFPQIVFGDVEVPYLIPEMPKPSDLNVRERGYPEMLPDVKIPYTPLLPPLEFSPFDCTSMSLWVSDDKDGFSVPSPLLYHVNIQPPEPPDKEKAFLLNHGQAPPDPDFNSYRLAAQEQSSLLQTSAETLRLGDTPALDACNVADLADLSSLVEVDFPEPLNPAHEEESIRNGTGAADEHALSFGEPFCPLPKCRISHLALNPPATAKFQASPQLSCTPLLPRDSDIYEALVLGILLPCSNRPDGRQRDRDTEQIAIDTSQNAADMVNCEFEDAVAVNGQDAWEKETLDVKEDWEWEWVASEQA